MAWEQLEKMPEADVVCTDGRIGQLEMLGVEPGTDEINSLIVRRGFFFHRDILVPISEVQDIEPDRDLIRLRVSREEADRMEPFFHLPDLVNPVVDTLTAPARWMGDILNSLMPEKMEAKAELVPERMKVQVEVQTERPEPSADLFDQGVHPHRINLNTATVRELEGLRGLGRGTAEEIVKNRPYRTVEELTKVQGINMDLVDRLREALDV